MSRIAGNSSKQAAKMWEQLRKDARKLEGELDVKLANYSRLCTGYDRGVLGSTDRLGQQSVSQSSTDITSLLQRLGDVNNSMEAAIDGSEVRQHTLSRHKDILQDFEQEFKRLSTQVHQARDRAELLSGAKEVSPLLGVTVQSNSSALLRERNAIQASTAGIDSVLGQAGMLGSSLREQRGMFDNIGSKLMTAGSKFPVINGLMNAIRRRKSRDTVVMTSVVVICTLLLLTYWLRKYF